MVGIFHTPLFQDPYEKTITWDFVWNPCEVLTDDPCRAVVEKTAPKGNFEGRRE